MATNHTENYALNLWEPTDTFSRTEFNENSVKLDAAIKAVDAKASAKADAATVNAALSAHDTALGDKIRMVTGSYVGTGGHGSSTVIDIPDAERPPRFVVVQGDGSWYRLTLIRGQKTAEPFCWDGVPHAVNLTWTNTGVKWYHGSEAAYQLNEKGKTYHYVAFI